MPSQLHNAKCFHRHIGMWLAEPRWLYGAVNAVKAGTMPLRAQGEADVVDPADRIRMDIGNIAVINISGAIMKGDSKFSGVTSSIRIRQAIRDASRDDAIKAVLLNIDSPGGTAAGTDQLANDVLMAREVKPVRAHIEDLGASAAFWIASQAEEISATELSEVGSIGTVAIVEDTSRAAEAAGVTVHVVSTGPMKGAFAPGVEVTEEMLGTLQAQVNEINQFFLRAVHTGRGMEKRDVSDVATGDTFLSSQAKKLGLL